jgi:hypothetical protein
MANAGDVNGDGFEDILVGPGQEHGGAALYLGGPGADSIPDLLISAPSDPTVSPVFGAWVSGGGDVNGDGYSDFAVGDTYNAEGHGAVYIYYGGRVLDAVPDLVLRDPSGTTFQFGPSVSLDSDFNGDAIDDVAVGSPGWESAEPCGGELPLPCGSPQGRTYVYFGGPDLGTTPDVVLTQPQPWHAANLWQRAFGSTVASAGDVTGDHIQDILIAEPDARTPSVPGRAVLFLGGSSPDSIPDQVVNIFSLFAIAQPISSAGDFNADGFGDIVVSAPILTNNGNSATMGHAYVYFGSSPLKPDYSAPDLVLGSDTPSLFGMYVHGGRDLDGDGISDVMAGMPGRTFVYLGSVHPDANPDVVLEHGSVTEAMYTPLTAADWNGDGVADPIVSGRERRDGPGTVYIFDTSTPLPGQAFARGGHRTVPLAQPGPLALHFQPVGGSYENSAVDPTTLRLVSTGTGSVSEIASVPGKTMVEGDTDHDGIPELVASFRAEDLRQLFSSLRGRQEVEAAIEGRLLSRRRFQAPVTLAIVGTGKPEERLATLSPNPLNPQGTLEFTMAAPGPVTLRLYDVAGRRVRTLLENQLYAGGIHRVPIAARDDRGVVFPSGVYFYRLELPSGIERGRFVVAK